MDRFSASSDTGVDPTMVTTGEGRASTLQHEQKMRPPLWFRAHEYIQDMFYEKADALVGICRDHATNSSRTLTLDLEAIGEA